MATLYHVSYYSEGQHRMDYNEEDNCIELMDWDDENKKWNVRERWDGDKVISALVSYEWLDDEYRFMSEYLKYTRQSSKYEEFKRIKRKELYDTDWIERKYAKSKSLRNFIDYQKILRKKTEYEMAQRNIKKDSGKVYFKDSRVKNGSKCFFNAFKKIGKEKGYLTYDEIIDFFRDDISSYEDFEMILRYLRDGDITFIETKTLEELREKLG